MKPVAIITARGGSKRIPKKNIKRFCGKPIIAYSIEAALKSGLFDDVIVSTDSDEIADIAREYGASVPFMRSADNSSDYADTSDVLLEVLDQLRGIGKDYKIMCCIYPTAPFITPNKLKDSFGLMSDTIKNVVPMVRFSFPPQRGIIIKDGISVPYDFDNIEKRSQDLEPIYHDAGQFYWIDVDEFYRNENFLYNKTVLYEVSEMEVQDIDDFIDWKLAEVKYSLMEK